MQIEKLIEILLELRSASIQVNQAPTDANIHELHRKYDMLFFGKQINCMYTNNLAHSISTVFNIPVTNDELTNLIPSVCDTLNMKYKPMIEAKDAGKSNPSIACYKVMLW